VLLTAFFVSDCDYLCWCAQARFWSVRVSRILPRRCSVCRWVDIYQRGIALFCCERTWLYRADIRHDAIEIEEDSLAELAPTIIFWRSACTRRQRRDVIARDLRASCQSVAAW